MFPLKILCAALFAVLFWVGCAGPAITPSADPESLLHAACEPGSDIRSVKGSLWMKVASHGTNGQLPAEVVVHAPRTIHLEVTNLIGATQAVIDVKDGRYRIEALDKNGVLKTMGAGKDSWGGIPLRWAYDLFLGRIPCPNETTISGAKLSIEPDQSLKVQTDRETFTFRFRSWAGRPWAEGLIWESTGPQKGDQKRVEFKFDDPEDKTRSPKKWEARSSDGEVKVRWKDREIAR